MKTAIALDAADEDVFEHARLDQRVIVTADTDFGDLLAAGLGGDGPQHADGGAAAPRQ